MKRIAILALAGLLASCAGQNFVSNRSGIYVAPNCSMQYINTRTNESRQISGPVPGRLCREGWGAYDQSGAFNYFDTETHSNFNRDASGRLYGGYSPPAPQTRF